MRRSTLSLVSVASFTLVAACSDSFSAPTQLAAGAALHARAGSPAAIPVFVVGDAEAHAVNDMVNFWGAQWWKNNLMTGTVSDGVASFKGYAVVSDTTCGGTWESRPGNSFDPPATIGEDVLVIVTSKVVKHGASISGDIQQVMHVHQDGGYGPNPGHDGNGVVSAAGCGGGPIIIY